MGKILTLDQAYESIMNNSLQCNYYNMFKEASDRGDCQLMQSDGSSSIEILYRMDEDLGENIIGLVIFPFGSDITVYTAIEDKYGLRAKLQVVDGISETSTLPEIITTAKAKLNICPVCGKEVPYKEQQQYGFAGRCCIECLPSMQQEHEQPGWYN